MTEEQRDKVILFSKDVVTRNCSHLGSTGYFQESEREAIVTALNNCAKEISNYSTEMAKGDAPLSSELYFIGREIIRLESFRLYLPKVSKNKRYKGMKGN